MFDGWKTVTFFVLTALVAIAGMFGFYEWQPSGDQAELLAVILSVVGLVLRFVTKTKVFNKE